VFQHLPFCLAALGFHFPRCLTLRSVFLASSHPLSGFLPSDSWPSENGWVSGFFSAVEFVTVHSCCHGCASDAPLGFSLSIGVRPFLGFLGRSTFSSGLAAFGCGTWAWSFSGIQGTCPKAGLHRFRWETTPKKSLLLVKTWPSRTSRDPPEGEPPSVLVSRRHRFRHSETLTC
jgi:hypothetical protein